MGNDFLEAFTNEGFAPCDVPFRSLHAMGDAVINAMLPESEIKTVRISLFLTYISFLHVFLFNQRIFL